MGRVRVKICCLASPAEARMAAEAGADLLGLVGPMPSGAGVVSPQTCRNVSRATPAWATPVLLTSSDTAEDILADIAFAEVRAVQLVRHVEPSVHRALKNAFPGLQILQVVHVEGPSALDLIPRYPEADVFLLDSGCPSAAELGGTGRTHDWSVSQAFVTASEAPVFLAGGLHAANVAGAIARVRPFGVDICSGVRTEDRLDPTKLSAFLAAVHSVEVAA